MPKRLLGLGKTSKDSEIHVKLEDTSQNPLSSEETEYAALSYCWGGKREVKLEAASTQTLSNRFAISKLPKTLFDSHSKPEIRPAVHLDRLFLHSTG